MAGRTADASQAHLPQSILKYSDPPQSTLKYSVAFARMRTPSAWSMWSNAQQKEVTNFSGYQFCAGRVSRQR